jgi:hypothetical protein
MTAGVGLFGALSGFLANTFLTPPTKREAPAATPAAPDGAFGSTARIAERR